MIRDLAHRFVAWLTDGIGEVDAMGVPIVEVMPCSRDCCTNAACLENRA